MRARCSFLSTDVVSRIAETRDRRDITHALDALIRQQHRGWARLRRDT